MNSRTPRRIASGDELRVLHEAGAGYVYNHSYRALHGAGCKHVEQMSVGTSKTFYATLDDARAELGGAFNPCPDCLPLSAAMPPVKAQVAASPAHRAEFEGSEATRGVYMWLDTRLPFEGLDEGQVQIRSELRSRLARLVANGGEILHAVYAGPRYPGSDVENLLLYYVDMDGGCFRDCARDGVRFEVAPGSVRNPPAGGEFNCCYAYRLAPRGAGFTHWQAGRKLAWFDNVHIEARSGTLLGRTWLAVQRATAVLAADSIAKGAPFAIELSVCGDADVSNPTIVKSLIDGVVAAFQAHADPSSLDEVVTRVAHSLEIGGDEVARLLTRNERAVLGVRKRLLWPWRDVVQWNPGDDLCLAGEVLSEGTADQWLLTGRITEIEPR